jgi:type IV pilus assembly protein PilB
LVNSPNPIRLGDLLVNAGAVSEKQLQSALMEQQLTNLRLGEILIKNGFLTERQLAEALSSQLKLPMVTLARYRPMIEALRMVPENVARRLDLLPLAVLDNNRLFIAMADPLNIISIDEVRMLTGMEVDVGVAIPSEIRRDMDSFYSVRGNVDDAIVEIVDMSAAEEMRRDFDAAAEASVDDAPVVKLVNGLLDQAVRESASDLHIEPFEKSSRVRYRVDGNLFDALDFPRNLHPAVISRLKIMANMDISEKRRPQDGRILLKFQERKVDLRVSSLPTVFGEKMVMRVLDQASSAVGLERIGLLEEDRGLLDGIISRPYGMMLVTGPTGSGKSTTLYSVLERINEPESNLITVEDPVEYMIPGINQVQINEKAGLTFADALRSILRQDPDKIMVGEIRDTETAQLAVRAALTGHLVLSTLHTNDAPSAVIRLNDMGVAPFLISSSVIGVIAQRLVRKLCPACKEAFEPGPNVCREYQIPEGSRIYKAVGCEQCRWSGYKGRTAVFQMMTINDEIRRLIAEEAQAREIEDAALRNGMRSLRDAGLLKVLEGVSSMEEVLQETTIN